MKPIKSNCPSCGAEIAFTSSVSVFAVCSHCRTMIVRHDMDLESLGTMAQLPSDVSPIKIGSRGRYDSHGFEVVGRLKVSWSEGYWNEWFLRFNDGSHGWLAEAMGFFMVSNEVTKTDAVPPVSNLAPDQQYELLPQRIFSVNDIRETKCVGSEGELPLKGIAGRVSTSVDLLSSFGEFANIEYSTDDGVRLFVGKYVNFDDLNWSNLRDLSADALKPQAVQFKCLSCGGPISLRTPGCTATVACSYCGSQIDTTDQNLLLVNKAEEKMAIKPFIPLGTKGSLFGTAWEVTGFVRRTDGTGAYDWDEYLLFNPYRGFRWLTAAAGHWNFVEMLRGRPVPEEASRTVVYRHRKFEQFLAGKAVVSYVLGEFYWRVRTGDTVGVADYIAPPEMLSREMDRNEIVWSCGSYVEPEDIQAAFKLKQEMPPKLGVAPNQPSPYAKNAKASIWAFAILACLLTVLQILFVISTRDRQILNETVTFDPAMPNAYATQSFELPGDIGNVETFFQSPVSNDWLEANFSLVNDQTQQGVDFELGAEYYYGTDSDGSWSEGSPSSSTLLSSVPGGRYHLVIQPMPSNRMTKVRTFTARLHRDVPIWSNYFLALFLLMLYPAYAWFRHRSFEMQRWSESDLSPYASTDEEE